MSSSSPALTVSLNFEEDVEFITLTPQVTPKPTTTTPIDDKFVTVHVSTTMLVDTTYVSVTPVSSSTPSESFPTPTPSTSRPTIASASTSTFTSKPVRHIVTPWNTGKSYAQVLREAQDQRDAADVDSSLSASSSPKIRHQQRVKAR